MQKRLVWLSALCYLVLQGVVPVGYMPSFGLSSSSTPFVLCHGDDASAQWLDIQQNIVSGHSLAGHSPAEQTAVESLRASEKDKLLSQNMAHEAGPSDSHSSSNFAGDSNSHLASFDCSFSSFYFTQALVLFATPSFTPDDIGFKVALPSRSFVTNIRFAQLQARGPPLSIFSFIAST